MKALDFGFDFPQFPFFVSELWERYSISAPLLYLLEHHERCRHSTMNTTDFYQSLGVLSVLAVVSMSISICGECFSFLFRRFSYGGNGTVLSKLEVKVGIWGMQRVAESGLKPKIWNYVDLNEVNRCGNPKTLTSYLLLQIVFTNANSTSDPNMNPVHMMNQYSVALTYDTLGKELPMFLDNVMNVSIVLVPVEHFFISIFLTLFSMNSDRSRPALF